MPSAHTRTALQKTQRCWVAVGGAPTSRTRLAAFLSFAYKASVSSDPCNTVTSSVAHPGCCEIVRAMPFKTSAMLPVVQMLTPVLLQQAPPRNSPDTSCRWSLPWRRFRHRRSFKIFGKTDFEPYDYARSSLSSLICFQHCHAVRQCDTATGQIVGLPQYLCTAASRGLTFIVLIKRCTWPRLQRGRMRRVPAKHDVAEHVV